MFIALGGGVLAFVISSMGKDSRSAGPVVFVIVMLSSLCAALGVIEWLKS
jgi:hypothetical protein